MIVEDEHDNYEFAFDYNVKRQSPWSQLFTVSAIHALRSTSNIQ